MKQLPWLVAPFCVLAAGGVVAATLLHYTDAHRLGLSGGYGALSLGAIAVGFLATLSVRAVAPVGRTSRLTAALIGSVAAMATAGILTATLIWSFGT